MAEGGPQRIATPRPGLSAGVLAVTVELFALTTVLWWPLALAVGGAGAAAAIALRHLSGGRRTDTSAGLVLLVVAVLAIAAPDSRAAGLTGGLVVLALLLWLADEPGRVGNGMRRALPTVGVVGLAFAAAWASAFLFPATSVPTGVIGGLLVLVILLATALLARPELIEEEPTLTTA